MGVSSVQITKLLSGKENIGLQTIAKVERALGRSLVVFKENVGEAVYTTSQSAFCQVSSLQLQPVTISRLHTDKMLV